MAEAESYTREGVRLAEQGDDRRALGMALAELGHWTFCGGGGVKDELFERAIALDGSAGAFSSRSHRAKVTMDAGNLDAARQQLDQILIDATAQGDLRGVAAHPLHLAELEMWAGNWAKAIDHADESLLLHEFDQPSAPRYVKAMAQACLGQVALGRQEAETGLAEAERSENVVLIMQNYQKKLAEGKTTKEAIRARSILDASFRSQASASPLRAKFVSADVRPNPGIGSTTAWGDRCAVLFPFMPLLLQLCCNCEVKCSTRGHHGVRQRESIL